MNCYFGSMKYFIYLLTLVLYFGCAERNPMDTEDNRIIIPSPDTGVLQLLSPVEFGGIYTTNGINYREAVFVDHQAADVWTVFVRTATETRRLDLGLDFGQIPEFIMFTDKYQDREGGWHLSVYCAVAEQPGENIQEILVTVAGEYSMEEYNREFTEVSPDTFGNIVTTAQGDFIEARFNGLRTQDVWSILKTNGNNFRYKINVARKVNRPLDYYLRQSNEDIVVGLLYDSDFPVRNIEVIIKN